MRIHNPGIWLILLPMLTAASVSQASSMINMSTRAYLSGDGPLVHSGVVLQSQGWWSPVYPKMIAFGVRGPSMPIAHKMPNPALQLYQFDDVGPILTDQNDDWMTHPSAPILVEHSICLLYTSDAADDLYTV